MHVVFFPSTNRSIDQSPLYRNYSIQPHETSHVDFIASFAAFQKIKELTLAAGYRHISEVHSTDAVILIPTVGNINIDLDNQSLALDAGQLVLIHPVLDQSISISNLSESELTNHLELWLLQDGSPRMGYKIHSFDLDKINELTHVNFKTGQTLSIGKYQGRAEGKINLINSPAAFVYIIHGVFEFANRLMEAGDGMALYGSIRNLEFEALAQESILLILHQR